MSATAVKEWMAANDKTVQDIAYALQIHPQTVYRFLQGKSVQRSTKAAIERFVKDHQAQEAKIAAG